MRYWIVAAVLCFAGCEALRGDKDDTGSIFSTTYNPNAGAAPKPTKYVPYTPPGSSDSAPAAAPSPASVPAAVPSPLPGSQPGT
jgi:hypothetical protein